MLTWPWLIISAKDYDNAIRISNTGLSMNLQSFIAAANWPPLVWSYLEQNKFDKAEEIVKKIPENDPLYMELATDIAIARGEKALALANLQKMKDYPHSRLAEDYLELECGKKQPGKLKRHMLPVKYAWCIIQRSLYRKIMQIFPH